MDRVLEAERNAQLAIADCEQRMQDALENARQQRRTILERAHARIVALQVRAARALELRTARIREQQEKPAGEGAAQDQDRAQLRAAIDRLIERLTHAD
jgi:hypothetical protein